MYKEAYKKIMHINFIETDSFMWGKIFMNFKNFLFLYFIKMFLKFHSIQGSRATQGIGLVFKMLTMYEMHDMNERWGSRKYDHEDKENR